MAAYVVDTSVIIERLMRGQYTPNAQALFHQRKPDDRFVIPEFCLVECTNVIWKYVRFQGMTVAHGQQLDKDLRGLPLKRVPVKALLTRALNIALRHQLAVYDAVYIALAEKSRHPLITLDIRQEQAAKSEGIVIKALTDFK